MAKAQEYIRDLAAGGRYHFSTSDMAKTLGISHNAARLSLYRLAKRGLVASPARGFYVVIPPEYRSLGSLPADQFLPSLMEWRKIPYYAGLLTAAQYHGAAHHRPQVFQAMVERNERPIRVGSVQIRFIARKRLRRVAVQSFNTPRGTVQVSTAEATAIDLAGYPRHAGGLDQVATVLSELAEKIDAKRLAVAARSAPLPWVQRLGYLLELVGAREPATALKEYVRKHVRDWTPLVPSVSRARARTPRGRLAGICERPRGVGNIIPLDYITAWRANVPWVEDSQVEQDLIISRALVEIFSEHELASTLAFRGGTALHKLHFRPAVRYSEDLDLVQMEAGAIGPVLTALHKTLDPWLGEPQRNQTEGRVTLNYRFDSEDTPPLRLRLKVEINSREHFTVFGYKKVPFTVDSKWFVVQQEL